MLGFDFERGNQSRSSSPDPPYSDPLQFRVEFKSDFEGDLFDKDRKKLIKYNGSTNFSDTYQVPEGVETIGEYSLSYSFGLREIRLPGTVKFIGASAFQGNRLIRRINIPEGVEVISYGAFNDCRDLERIDLPDSITSIGDYAFTFCYYLKSVRIPASVERVGSYSFAGCGNLQSVVFMGNGCVIGQGAFQNTGSGFRILHFNTATGITSPKWNGYTTFNLGAYSPKVPWLLSWGLPHDAGLEQDLRGDGITLLFAYSFNLDPFAGSGGILPEAGIEGGSLNIRYFSRAEGIDYFVEYSETLDQWSDDLIFYSARDPNGFTAASVEMNAPTGFFRIGVQYAY